MLFKLTKFFLELWVNIEGSGDGFLNFLNSFINFFMSNIKDGINSNSIKFAIRLLELMK
jgi:hypothetical protein